jgi:hypothetical protein
LWISIFIAQWFDSEVCGIEQSPVDTFASESTVGVNLADELDAFTLFWHSPNFLKLAAQKPKVRQEYGFS